MSAEQKLALFVSKTNYEALPEEVIQATKRNIFDTIGVGIGGSSSPGIGQVIDYAREMGGKESSAILTCGTRVPPANAALVNGDICHALDHDDTHDRAVLQHRGIARIRNPLVGLQDSPPGL